MNDEIKALMERRDTLQAEISSIEAQIAEKQAEAKKATIDKMRTMMAEAGITLSDFEPARGSRVQPGVRATKGRKVPAKYRNPTTGDTWSGRGIKPKWMQAALADGKTLEDFAIKG